MTNDLAAALEARERADREQRAADVAAELDALLIRLTGKLTVAAALLDELSTFTQDHGRQDSAGELMLAARLAGVLADERLRLVVGDVAARLPPSHR